MTDNSQQDRKPAKNDQDDKPDAGKDKKKKGVSPRTKVLLIAGVILIAIIWLFYWLLTRNHIETDDAYTQGRKISIAPHVNGYVTDLRVNDNQFVRHGQVLLTIDDRDYRASLDKAMASLSQASANLSGAENQLIVASKKFPGQLTAAQGALAAAKADLFKAETDFKRQQRVSRAATTQQNVDYAKAALEQARARVIQAEGQLEQARPVQPNIKNQEDIFAQQRASLKVAEANLKLAELNMEWTQVKAPHDGWISQRNVEQGDFVQTGQKLFSIVSPEVWVVANYKETQITKMKPGQKAEISVDAYPSLHLKGHVDSIQLGAGAAFSAFPPENATGNFVKIVQRVPVKILIDKGLDPKHPLPLGVSVIPTVYVK